ncbi:MAG: methylamine utilization protein [Gammaproteobacteria bacterium]|nr:methylamine utilization protein [Gammaproteobacteria bacterium]
MKITLFTLCLTGSALVAAKTITLVDEQGRPFINAVISVKSAAGEESSPPTPSLQPAIMDQVNRQFEPTTLVIEQGRKVVFPNSDNIRHHVYSFSQPKPFEIKLYAGDSVPPVQFDKSGIVVLGCNIHDSMLGFIYVKDGNPSWQTNQNGQAEITTAQDEILIWHPDLSVNHIERLPYVLTDSEEPVTITLSRVAQLETSKRVFGNSKFKRQ